MLNLVTQLSAITVSKASPGLVYKVYSDRKQLYKIYCPHVCSYNGVSVALNSFTDYEIGNRLTSNPYSSLLLSSAFHLRAGVFQD